MILRFIILLLIFVVQALRREGDPCVERYYNAAGICTKAYQCISAKNDYLQRNISPTLCGSRNDAVICCRNTRSSGSQPIRNNNNNRNKIRKRVSEIKCEEYSRAVTKTVVYTSLVPDPDTYSKSVSNCTYTSKELIVGGEDAARGEFPHMAAIGWVDLDGGYAFNCGGSLISARFVLTAGHCTYDPRAREHEPAIVRLGEHNVDPDVDDGADPVDVPIKAIHKHPEYNPPNRYNDIALLEFDAVPFNSYVRPACLWNQFGFGDHTQGIATGWGVNDTTKETRKDELQKVSLSLLDNDYCDKKLVKLRGRHWGGFTDTQMCAGELRGKKDTCQGDSGSPLQVVSSENQCIFHIVGVVSFGPRCATGQPAIYSRVYKYLDWIESVVWPGEQ